MNKRVTVNITEEEYRFITNNASGVNFSDKLRHVITVYRFFMDKRFRNAPPVEVFEEPEQLSLLKE